LGGDAILPEIFRRLSGAATSLRVFGGNAMAAETPVDVPAETDFEGLSLETTLAASEAKEACEGIVLASQSARALARVSLLKALEAIRRSDTASTKLDSARTAVGVATRLFDHFITVRSAAVESVYDQILPDLQRYYSKLHPGEPHKDVLLKFDKKKRKSTSLEMTSFSHRGTDPRAFSSEAHLDTLGLCIFLAFYKGCSADFPLLVLDDVLTTVDAQHRMKVAELLIDEFGDRQLVLTTHDERWFEEIKARIDARTLSAQFAHLNIVGWSVDGGPEIREVKPTWDRIAAYLAEGDKGAAGNQARIYLEWILEEMCKGCRVAVPYSHPRKPPLEDLFNGAKARLTDLVRDPTGQAALKKGFEDVAATKFMGNVLSHNNPEGGPVSTVEISSFADAVKALHGAYSCAECHALLIYSEKSNELYCPKAGCVRRTRYDTRK
jgi:hypothetical protein